MFKRLVMIAIVGGALFAAWNAAHPAPLAADPAAAGEVAAVDNSLIGRMKHKIGEVTANMVGGQVRASVAKTESQLSQLKPAIKRSQGSGKKRAMEASKKVMALDSLTLRTLDQSHPIAAIKLAIDARGYIDLIKQEVYEEISAR